MIPGAPGPRAALRPTLRLVANCDRGRGYVRSALRRSLFAVFVAQSLCRSSAPLGLPAQPHSQREPSSVTKTNRAPRQWRFRSKSSRLESDCPCFPSVSESVSEMKQRRRDGNSKDPQITQISQIKWNTEKADRDSCFVLICEICVICGLNYRPKHAIIRS